jgi:hypothetical protein
VAKREDQAFQQRLEQLDGLIQAIESFADPAARANAREAIQMLMELHGAGLERILEIVAVGDAPAGAIIDRFARDDLVGSLLLLYGLHPLDLDTRVRQALDKARPYCNRTAATSSFLASRPMVSCGCGSRVVATAAPRRP